VLSISEKAFSGLHDDLQLNQAFVTVKSLTNQTVAIRTKAIADLYFSSEAYDTYGPEHDTYTNHASLQMPDSRDWEIVEALEHDIDPEDFDRADVQRVQRMIMITDEPYAQLVADATSSRKILKTSGKRTRKKRIEYLNWPLQQHINYPLVSDETCTSIMMKTSITPFMS
jgi:hypothetical protein